MDGARGADDSPDRVPVPKPRYRALAGLGLRVCVTLILSGLFGWAGVQSWKSAAYSAVGKLVFHIDPLQALEANHKAYELFPYTTEIRRQLVNSFTQTMTVYRERLQMDVHTVNTILGVGETVSPYDPLYLIGRIQFSYFYNPDPEAARPYLDTLMTCCSAVPETWLAWSYYHGLRGSPKEAERMARRGLDFHPNDSTRASLSQMIGDSK